VRLMGQADPGWDGSDGTRAPTRDPITLGETDGMPDGYQAFLQELRADTIDFGKPVVYVNGDSHYFRVDKPLADADRNTGNPPTGKRIENFPRLETFGDNAQSGSNAGQWGKVLVEPSGPEACAFHPQFAPENGPSYTPNP